MPTNLTHSETEVQQTHSDAHVDRATSSICEELREICNHEVRLLENRWLQIGQFQKPPNRLIENVITISARNGLFDQHLKDSVIDEVKLLFRYIRRALRVISFVRENPGPIPFEYQSLARKATTFIKRLSHDKDLSQSVRGARRFRKYEKLVKTQQKLLKPVCDPEVFDLGMDWRVEKLVSQQALLNVGQKLQLCVNKRKGSAKQYFNDLVKQRSTFWLVFFWIGQCTYLNCATSVKLAGS